MYTRLSRIVISMIVEIATIIEKLHLASPSALGAENA
jgi:hypothetical protein